MAKSPDKSPEKYQILDSREVWRGHIYNIRVDDVRMPDGNVREREVLTHAGAVGIVAVTVEREVILVRQYRHAIGGYLLEIPAGKLDREESPAACARRELKEEAGVEFRDLVELTDFYNSPGYSSELFHLYMAEITSIGEMQPDGDEELEMERLIVPLDKALEMIDNHEIIDAKSIIGLLMVARLIAP